MAIITEAGALAAVNPFRCVKHVVLALAAIVSVPALGYAQATAPSPSSSASASPSPSPTPGFSLQVTGTNVVVSQSASGPGLSPPEAGSFINGLPLSPMSPYDWFTGAVESPGNATAFQYMVNATERTRDLSFTGAFAFGAYWGDVNNELYWGEPMFPTGDPHEGYSSLNYGINFPTHQGQVGLLGTQATLPYSLGIESNDGAWKVIGGFFNLTQTDRFVFAPPAITSVDPSVGVATAETLGPGMPNLDSWNPSPTTLPLLGADATYTKGSVTAEASDSLLPVLTGMEARMLEGSIVDDRGAFGRFSAQAEQIDTAGTPIGTTTFFGTNQTLYPGAQGRLSTSTLDDQYQTIAGIRGLFHPLNNYDALIELGRAWYSVTTPDEPNTNRPGTWEHFAITRHFTDKLDAGVEYFRFDPRYATIILPYGIPENVWSVAWSWPGNWLKSTYQAVDNSTIGINRLGYRAHADYAAGKLELHADTYVWRQVEPITFANASQDGWVDGFFLLENNANPNLGWQRQVNVYAAWHLGKDDLTLDAVWDRSYRPAGSDPIDLVDTNYPQVVGSWQHHWGKRALAAVGYGRYAASGTWSTTPIDAIYGSAFAGGQWDFGNGQQILLSVRRYGLNGLPSIPGGPSPLMRGTAIVLDHRIAF